MYNVYNLLHKKCIFTFYLERGLLLCSSLGLLRWKNNEELGRGLPSTWLFQTSVISLSGNLLCVLVLYLRQGGADYRYILPRAKKSLSIDLTNLWTVRVVFKSTILFREVTLCSHCYCFSLVIIYICICIYQYSSLLSEEIDRKQNI